MGFCVSQLAMPECCATSVYSWSRGALRTVRTGALTVNVCRLFGVNLAGRYRVRGGLRLVVLAAILLVLSVYAAASAVGFANARSTSPPAATSNAILGTDWMVVSECHLLFESHRIEFRRSMARITDASGGVVCPPFPRFVGSDRVIEHDRGADGAINLQIESGGWPFRTWLLLESTRGSGGLHRQEIHPLWGGILLSITVATCAGVILGSTVWGLFHLVGIAANKAAGKCCICGYDRRGSEDRCPECGFAQASFS